MGVTAESLVLISALAWGSHRAARHTEDLQMLLVPWALRHGDLLTRSFPRRERTLREDIEDPATQFPTADLRVMLENSARNASPVLRLVCPAVAAIAEVTCVVRAASQFTTSPSPSLGFACAATLAAVATVVFWIVWRDMRLGQRRNLPRLRAESWAHRYQPERPALLVPAAPVFLVALAPLLVVAVGWQDGWRTGLAGTVAAIGLASVLWRGRARVDGPVVRWIEARKLTAAVSRLIARLCGAQRAVERIRTVVGALALASLGIMLATPHPSEWVSADAPLIGFLLGFYLLCWFMSHEERPPRPVQPVTAARWLREAIGPVGEKRITDLLDWPVPICAAILVVVLAFV